MYYNILNTSTRLGRYANFIDYFKGGEEKPKGDDLVITSETRMKANELLTQNVQNQRKITVFKR